MPICLEILNVVMRHFRERNAHIAQILQRFQEVVEEVWTDNVNFVNVELHNVTADPGYISLHLTQCVVLVTFAALTFE